MKVLIVDDDRTARAFFRRELLSGGYDIVEASDGFEAIHVIHEQDIDLVLLDIEMPDMDGYQVCTWLRSEQFSHRFNQKKTGLLPIIFVTSDHTLESRLKGFRAGATDFVTKDFKAGELLETIDRLLRPRNVLEGLTALVVDDSKMVRNMVTGMLKEQGISVFEAVNGQQGYEILKENADQVDMVITDLEMPIMKGDELCFKIRKDLGLKDLPVIFLTAIPDRNVLINLFNAGANDYLVKPFVKEELIARLKVTKELLQTLGDEVAERKRVMADLNKTKEVAMQHVKAAGRVDLANSVLHNVGNVLNSVNVSCAQIDNFLASSRLSQCLLALRLLEKNRDNLPEFLTSDPKGKQLPDYFRLVSNILEEEHQQLNEEVKEMRKKMQLMKDLVDAQQNASRSSTRIATTFLGGLVDESLKVNRALIDSFHVYLDVDYDQEIQVKVLQVEFTHVLINIIKNGIEAMGDSSDRVLKIRANIQGSMLHLSVSDCGHGISEENMEKMFTRGFTTKESGHGFGLPFCLESMRDMGGDLRVSSEGMGKGATFTLVIPLHSTPN